MGEVRHPDLLGAQAKLDRAWEHYEALQREHSRFLKEHPEPLHFAIHSAGDGHRAIMSVASIEEPGSSLSTTIGDVIHNLRCVVDYIAWQAVWHGTKPPPENSETAKKVGFPIVVKGKPDKRGRWRKPEEIFGALARDYLPGVLPVALSIIRRYQPYQRRNLAEGHPFAVLQDLSNTDKHRRIHPALTYPAQVEFEIVSAPEDCQVLGAEPAEEALKGLRVGSKVAYITMADQALCDGMEIKPTATAFVGFEGGLPVFDALKSVHAMCGELLGEIDAIL